MNNITPYEAFFKMRHEIFTSENKWFKGSLVGKDIFGVKPVNHFDLHSPFVASMCLKGGLMKVFGITLEDDVGKVVEGFHQSGVKIFLRMRKLPDVPSGYFAAETILETVTIEYRPILEYWHEHSNVRSIPDFNDHISTTFEDILAVLDMALEKTKPTWLTIVENLMSTLPTVAPAQELPAPDPVSEDSLSLVAI